MWVPDPGKKRGPDLDPLSPLVHRLHVIVELRDVREPSKVLLLLGQIVLNELIQVPVLGQLQQPQVRHLVALKALTLGVLLMLLCLESWKGKAEKCESRRKPLRATPGREMCSVMLLLCLQRGVGA